jgi:hypothetical protein|tara:strand:- start:303 stop:716 length:414 start_codon:yes stop_codon:yes gene_type:complete
MSSLLDTLIPGDADFPTPGAVGLHDALVMHVRFGGPYLQVTSLLPKGFALLPQEERAKVLSQIEQKHPLIFNGLIVGVYSLYYTEPKVAIVIEKLTGHTARPPQPAGHQLVPFDPKFLTIPAARAQLYRPTPETDNA